MTRTRAFHRFHRWTARLRRRHLRTWLPELRDPELRAGEPPIQARGAELRQRARAWAELRELDCLGDANQVLEQQLL
jgi:hypothetical protein